LLTIKFSHSYQKLKGDKKAKLLAIFIAEYSELSSSFLEYDTRYFDDGELKYYFLTDGKYLVLLFQGNQGNLFTTVRSYTDKKSAYYKMNVGQWFEIETK
jgi:hypothetical protein